MPSKKHKKPSKDFSMHYNSHNLGEAEDYCAQFYGEYESPNRLVYNGFIHSLSLDEELYGIIDIESLKGIRARKL